MNRQTVRQSDRHACADIHHYVQHKKLNESKPFINSSVDVKSVPAAFLAVQLYVPLSFPRKLFNVSKENESVLSI